MNAPVRPVLKVQRHYAAPVPAVSSGIGAGDMSGLLSGRPIDLPRFKAVFPDRWSSFLRAHFKNSVEVAYFFGVDEKAARNWWNGVTAPRAEVVLALVERCPTVLPLLIDKVA